MVKIEKQEQPRTPWLWIIGGIIVFSIISFFVFIFAVIFIASDSEPTTGNVAVIPMKGVIMIDSEDRLFSTNVASSTEIVALIKKAENDPSIKAIVFDINSPGGAPVASAEIARAIKESNKPTVAVIREVGASGAYWAASAADHIIANEVSITGSIGVLASYLEYGDFLTRYNVSYARFVSGDHKDMGSPYREMTNEEKEIYQQTLDKLHAVFIGSVAENRRLEYGYVEELATGQIYIGSEAVDLGLIDQLGGKQEAYAYIGSTLNITVAPVLFEEEKSFFEVLASALDNSAFHVGTGIGAVLVEDDRGIKI
ncbi:signal peptide peptidase SppA [Candidatus Woesearchaeota archaeon]|nr:signal peptide peptidase SppA [Candidatus Woesearchaeota archaeon]